VSGKRRGLDLPERIDDMSNVLDPVSLAVGVSDRAGPDPTETVTIVMPVRNEEATIAPSLQAALSQDYPPESMEILIVDGESTDSTRTVAERLLEGSSSAKRFARVSILSNPGLTAPAGLNLGLRVARGDVIIRLDGHCVVPRGYVTACVALLRASDAECVGGRIVGSTSGHKGKAIGLAQASLFGGGGARFRLANPKAGPADTVPFGAYRRSVFDHNGGFDEELVRDQDEELNFRIRKAGGTVWLDPSLVIQYRNREKTTALWRQYFGYGFYKVRVMQKRKALLSWRHVVPPVFVVALVTSCMVALGSRRIRVVLWMAIPYGLANLSASLWVGRRRLDCLPFLPVAFAAMHTAYGVGFLAGLWRWRRGWGEK
jgi:succinoglycan biosynthesis protein ExoA